jgi:hypothetical protein
MSTDLTAGVTGKTLRFSWTEGPTKGAKHDHVFHDDGTVEWHPAGEREKGGRPGEAVERPKVLDEGIASGIRLVSYLSRSGFTLTVVLNAQTGLIAGVASNDKTWVPVRGSFEVMT